MADWRLRSRAGFRAITVLHETARVDLGVSGSLTGERHPERDLLLPLASAPASGVAPEQRGEARGPAADHTLGDTRATILRHVRAHPGAKPKQIADATGLAPDLVRQTCARMANDVQLIRSNDGYTAARKNGGPA